MFCLHVWFVVPSCLWDFCGLALAYQVWLAVSDTVSYRCWSIATWSSMFWFFHPDVRTMFDAWIDGHYFRRLTNIPPEYTTRLDKASRIQSLIGHQVLIPCWSHLYMGCGGAGSFAPHVVVNALDNSWIRGRSGVVQGFTQSYSFSNQTIVAEWLFVMQSSAGRRVVCSARGGLSRVCYNGTLYPSNEGNPLVFWWIAVTLLWPGRGDFSASGLSTFKKIALTSALDCTLPETGGNHSRRRVDWPLQLRHFLIPDLVFTGNTSINARSWIYWISSGNWELLGLETTERHPEKDGL